MYDAEDGEDIFEIEVGLQQLLQVKYQPPAGGVPVNWISAERYMYFCIFPSPEFAPEQEVVPV